MVAARGRAAAAAHGGATAARGEAAAVRVWALVFSGLLVAGLIIAGLLVAHHCWSRHQGRHRPVLCSGSAFGA